MDDVAPVAGTHASPSEEALRQARDTLVRADATSDERAEALWLLGRAAYYGNRIGDAVRLLNDALMLIEAPGLRAEVVLMLAPALSKEGRPDAALDLLLDPSLTIRPVWHGQARNQRCIIFTDLGRLPEACDEGESAVALLREADDRPRLARALVNLAVSRSMLGQLDESEQLYAEARELTLATGQAVVAAGIEGNLGYVASRRGDFVAALKWYGLARQRFESFGDVDLLVGNLEVDHARTLLDVGLAVDAVDAADRAGRLASAGGNQSLELQSRLLSAEALIRLGDRRSAVDEIGRAHELASSLGHTASQLRIVYLVGEADIELPGLRAPSEVDEVVAFIDAGWGREAYHWILRRAQRLRRSQPDVARSLIHEAETLTASMDVDPVARATGSLVIASIDGDDAAVQRAFERALESIVSQRSVVGSVELQATMMSPVRGIAEIAVDHALGREDPAKEVLAAAELVRLMLDGAGGGRSAPDFAAADIERVRDARVALAEAKTGSGDVSLATATLRVREREMLHARRTDGAVPSGGAAIPSAGTVTTPPDDTTYVMHAVHRGRIIGVRHDRNGTVLTELGDLDEIAAVGRTQRAALRRLGDRRRRRIGPEIDRAASTSAELDERLLVPLGIDSVDRVVFTPAGQIVHLCWGGLPTLASRPLTLATSLRNWADDPHELSVRRLGFVGGPELDAVAHELDEIGELWRRPDAVQHAVTADKAAQTLARADLVHIAAHGAFRSDNVYFSSLVFDDRELTVLELSDLPRVPAVVVVASCDAAASSNPGGGVDDDVTVGTATELRRLGASVVVAPTVAVSDEAAAEFSIGFHRELAAGESIDDAFFTTKRGMIESGDPMRMATAWSFNLMGGRSTQQPLRIGR